MFICALMMPTTAQCSGRTLVTLQKRQEAPLAC